MSFISKRSVTLNASHYPVSDVLKGDTKLHRKLYVFLFSKKKTFVAEIRMCGYSIFTVHAWNTLPIHSPGEKIQSSATGFRRQALLWSTMDETDVEREHV